jgi:hypothetical protein
MSEPLFFFTGFAGIFLLIYYLRLNNRRMLAGAAVMTGVAFLTRYVGSAFLIAGALLLLLFQQGNLKKRLTDTIYYSGIGSLPMITWLVMLYSQPLMEPPRQFHFDIEEILSRLITLRLFIVDEIWSWIPYSSALPDLSYRTRLFTILLVIIILIILLVVGAKRFKSDDNKKWSEHVGFLLTSLFAFVIISYIVILAFTYSLTSPWPHLRERMMTPVYIVWILMIFSLLYFLSETTKSGHWLQLISVIVVVVITSSFMPRSVEQIERFHSEGRGFTGVQWRSSETIKRLDDIPPEILLISNEEEAILFYTNRPAYDIPELRNKIPLSNFYRFGDDKEDDVQTIFRDQKAALVLFDNAYWEFQAIYGEKAQQRMKAFTEGLDLYADYEDGAIYFYKTIED